MVGVKIKFKGLKDEKMMLIDKVRTQQILINLIQNSIKFSKSQDVIKVKIDQFTVTEQQGSIGVNIRVKDQGIGISEEDRANLF
jgi:signal transduction histidine kinase